MAVWCDSSLARGHVGSLQHHDFILLNSQNYTLSRPLKPEQVLIEVLAPGGEGIQGRGEVLFPPQPGLQGARIPYPPAPQPHGPGCLPWYTHLRRRPATRARRPRLALCHGESFPASTQHISIFFWGRAEVSNPETMLILDKTDALCYRPRQDRTRSMCCGLRREWVGMHAWDTYASTVLQSARQ